MALDSRRAFRRLAASATAVSIALFIGVGTASAQSAKATRSLIPTKQPGYLQKSALPDSVALLPKPPAAGSAAQALDAETAKAALTLRGTPRWDLAASDADLSFPHAADTFTCALGVAITEQATPKLYVLLQRVIIDAGIATVAAKDHYARPRPFVENKQAVCTPKIEDKLRANGAYPSGHTSLGWTWALLLAELAPDRGDALLRRGEVFGESRVVCNVHWESDVIAGRLVGDAVVARLHADAAFAKDLAEAKSELDAIRAKGAKPAKDCAAEAAAIGLAPLPSP